MPIFPKSARTSAVPMAPSQSSALGCNPSTASFLLLDTLHDRRSVRRIGRTDRDIGDELAARVFMNVDLVAGPALLAALVAPPHLRIHDAEYPIRRHALPQVRPV